MQRRKFITTSGIFAVGTGVFGSIRWSRDHYTGDTPTTTDILGPFYRPGAPLRKNLNPPGFKQNILHLSGTIFKENGTAPMDNCLIEIWQCKPDGFYDNVSDDYLYRAGQQVGTNGKYHFITAIPVPYANKENNNEFRPAHIHLRISAKGQQDLITQIYLKGDPYLATDPSTKLSLAVNRILSLNKIKDNEREIKFDITLRKEYLPDDAVFQKISGVYKMSDNSMVEFYRNGDFLFWKKNNQIRGGLSYNGDNKFVAGANDIEAKFELQQQGNAKVLFRFSRRKEIMIEGVKMINYKS
jgi:catechol 1,2-dioxygenase